MQKRTNSIELLPNSIEQSGSTQSVSTRTESAPTCGVSATSSTRPSPTRPRPSASARQIRNYSSVAAVSGWRRGNWKKRSPISMRPFASPRRDPLGYLNRAIAWQVTGELDKAIADLDEAIRLNLKDPGAYMVRGGAWEREGASTTRPSPT